jgi:hypothetical protein
VESLYELQGCLDLIIISFLIDLAPSPTFPPQHLQSCTHSGCPATCPKCMDLNYKLWGEREHVLSTNGKTSRSAQKDAALLSMVCKRWHAHIRHPKQNKLLWTRLALRTGSASDSLTKSLVSSFGRFISVVDLCNQKMLSDSAVTSILVNCESLSAVSIKRCCKITGSCFAFDGAAGPTAGADAEITPAPEEVARQGADPPASRKLPTLSNLALAGLDNLKDCHLSSVGKHFGAALETINLSGCPKITGRGVKSLTRQCPALISLDLCNTAALSQGNILSIIRKCQMLKSVNIGGCGAIGDEFVREVMADQSHNVLIYRR